MPARGCARTEAERARRRIDHLANARTADEEDGDAHQVVAAKRRDGETRQSLSL